MNKSILVKLARLLPDKLYLSIKFYKAFGRWPNWKKPQTFSEKLQWLKLYDRKPKYTTMVDKYAVKKYVADIIGEDYVIPTLGIWGKPEDIEWDKLPNQFVLKTTHGGGNEGVAICRDKATFDRKKAVRLLNESLKTDLYTVWREWPYKNVPKRIIAEKYIEPKPDIEDLTGYKFLCFDGEVKGLFVTKGRQNPDEEFKGDLFVDFNHLPFKREQDYAKIVSKKPKSFELMKKVAEQLSKGKSHIRIDLYDLGEKMFFGELTLLDINGMGPLNPAEWNKFLGDMINLPGERLGGVIVKLKDDGNIEVSQPDLSDYKWYCFNGEPLYCQVIQNRSSKETIDFFDIKWTHQAFVGLNPKARNAHITPRKPLNLDDQIRIARKLSMNTIFTRIDLYNADSKIYFGEITFYPNSGMGYFIPSVWNTKLGNMIKITQQ